MTYSFEKLCFASTKKSLEFFNRLVRDAQINCAALSRIVSFPVDESAARQLTPVTLDPSAGGFSECESFAIAAPAVSAQEF